MSFKDANKWQVVNKFTLRDGDHLHTCVPQMLIMKVNQIGARYSLVRNHAASTGEGATQNLGREIVGTGGIENAMVNIFSTETGLMGFPRLVRWRILPRDAARMEKTEHVSQMIGFQHSGLSAKEVPETGLMGMEGGLLTALYEEHCNPPWAFALALFMPQDHFDTLFNAIATSPTPPSNARIILRANLFETEVDAALNEGERNFGFMAESGDSSMAITAAMLDDFEFTLTPAAV